MPTCITASSGTESPSKKSALAASAVPGRVSATTLAPCPRAMSTASNSEGMPPTCEMAVPAPPGRCAAPATCCRWWSAQAFAERPRRNSRACRSLAMNHEVAPAPYRSTCGAAAMAATAPSSTCMSSWPRTPETEAAALRAILPTTSSAASSMLTRRCSGEPPSASCCASPSLNSRRPAKPRSRQVRMVVGTELRERSANCSKLSSSTRSGSSRIRSRIARRVAGAPLRVCAFFGSRQGVIGASGSEMHGDGVAHAVVVLDDGHPVPFVEGGAGMRDAEADTVADLGGLRFLAGVPAQVGVLVVERGDLPASGYGLRFERATRRARDGHGHRKVERDVALAHGEDRQAWLGARLHRGPHFHRRAQALAALAAQALVERAHHALVEAVVVRDVAARAQQAAHRRAQRGLQASGHEVEDRRTAGRDQHLVSLEELVRIAVARDGFHAVHQRVGIRGVGFADASSALPFIGFDADELDRIARTQARGERHRLFMRAATGARAFDADLEHHFERHACRMAPGPVFYEAELRQRIDQEHDAHALRLARQQLEIPAGFLPHQ